MERFVENTLCIDIQLFTIDTNPIIYTLEKGKTFKDVKKFVLTSFPDLEECEFFISGNIAEDDYILKDGDKILTMFCQREKKSEKKVFRKII